MSDLHTADGSDTALSPCVLLLAADEGNLNVGDQAMYLNACRRLRKQFPSARIVAVGRELARSISADSVERTAAGHKHFHAGTGRLACLTRTKRGQQATLLVRMASLLLAAASKSYFVYRWLWNEDCRAILDMIDHADVVVSCGGGYLNSIWRQDQLWPKAALYRAAALLGKPVILSGQGIGPITSRLDKLVLKLALNSAQFIGLREAGEGEAYLAGLGIPSSKYAVIGDDAVDLPTCSAARLEQILAEEGVDTDRPWVVANFRSTAYTSHYRSSQYVALAALLDRVVEAHGYSVLFVPFCYDDEGRVDDRTAAFDVTKHMKHRDAAHIIMGEYRPEEIKALVGTGQIAVGVSYHFAVFSLTQGIPCFTPYDNEYYRLKMKGLHAQFGDRDWLYALNTDGMSDMEQSIRIALADHHRVRQELLAATQQMVQRVDQVYALVDRVVQERNVTHAE